jgi:hypothetical protein
MNDRCCVEKKTGTVPVCWDSPTVLVEQEGRNFVGKKFPKLDEITRLQHPECGLLEKA